MKIGRLLRTLCHLKPGQLWFQVWRRVQRKLDPHPVCSALELPEFTFLNLSARPRGWNDVSLDMLWRYNLHYFDQGLELVPRWIAENPRGSVPGWDPYPTSLRIVNWVKAVDSGLLKHEKVKASLAEQLDWLANHLEYHILANHYLANLKAMVIGSIALKRDYGKWMRLYAEQVAEQILDDGGHYERSVMYHAIIFEDVLDVIRFCGDGAERLKSVAVKMLRYLVAMTGPDGKIVLFNDAADGIAKPTAWLADYAKRLGIVLPDVVSDTADGIVDFPQTGYARLQAGDFVLYVDVAPIGPEFQPGHAHADTLTYELYYKGVKVVADTGTSEYRGERRAFERSSAAHNVVQVDGVDSSEVWSSHRVGRRAKVQERNLEVSKDGKLTARGEILANGVRIARAWRLSSDGLEVTEQVTGGRTCVTRVHFAPEGNHSVQVDFSSPCSEDYACALEFGKVREAVCLSATFDPGRVFRYTISPIK